MDQGITNRALSDQLLALLDSGTGSSTFWDNLLSAAITLMFTVGAIVFLVILMVGGIQWITSGGDKASVESARGRVSSAVIGLAILLSVFAVVLAVEYFFGVNLTSFNLEDLKI
jgi:hypothetical protein